MYEGPPDEERAAGPKPANTAEPVRGKPARPPQEARDCLAAGPREKRRMPRDAA